MPQAVNKYAGKVKDAYYHWLIEGHQRNAIGRGMGVNMG